MATETTVVHSHTSPFREFADGLMLQRCVKCRHTPNFPRIACPRCFGEIEWFHSEGTGVVRSFTVIHRPHHKRFLPHVPIVMALIELREGSEVISTIVGDDRLQASIGSAVRVADGGWAILPQFRLDNGEVTR